MPKEIKDSSNRYFDCWRTYDKNNNLIKYRSSGGYSETRSYDVNNNLTHMIDSNGYQFWKEYNSHGSLTKSWNSYGYRVEKQYDHLNRLVSHFDSDGNKYKVIYDSDLDRKGKIIEDKNKEPTDCQVGSNMQYIKEDGTLKELDVKISDTEDGLSSTWLKYGIPSRFSFDKEKVAKGLKDFFASNKERIKAFFNS